MRFALHGAEREDPAVSRRLRRRIRSAHGRSRQARRTGVRRRSSSMWTIRRPRRSPITQTHSSNGPPSIFSLPVNLYTAYPDVTAKEIKALAAAADVSGAGELQSVSGDPAHQVAPCLRRGATDPAREGARDRRKTWTSRHASLRPVRAAGGQLRSVSLPSTTARSTSTSPISPRTSDRSSISYSSSPRTRRRRRAESTSRSSLTSRRERTALRSGSTRPIRA